MAEHLLDHDLLHIIEVFREWFPRSNQESRHRQESRKEMSQLARNKEGQLQPKTSKETAVVG